jgi:hypothetical protein
VRRTVFGTARTEGQQQQARCVRPSSALPHSLTARARPPSQPKTKTAFFVSLDLKPAETAAKVVQRLAAFAYSCSRHGNDTLACAADAGNFCAPLSPRLMPTARYAEALAAAAAGDGGGDEGAAASDQQQQQQQQQWPSSTCTYRETLAARGLATLACPGTRGARWASCFGLSDSRAACERKRADCVWDALEVPDASRALPYTGSVRCAPREAADLLSSGDRGVAEFYSALSEMASLQGVFWGDDCATAQELRRGASACDGLEAELDCVSNPLCAWMPGARVGGAVGGAAGSGACAVSPRANAAVYLLPPFSASAIAPGTTTTVETAGRVAAQVQHCGRLKSRDVCEAEEVVEEVAAAAAAAPATPPAAGAGGKKVDEGAAKAAAAPAEAPAPALLSVSGSVNVTYAQLVDAKQYNWYQAPAPPPAPLVQQAGGGGAGGMFGALARAMGLGSSGGAETVEAPQKQQQEKKQPAARRR